MFEVHIRQPARVHLETYFQESYATLGDATEAFEAIRDGLHHDAGYFHATIQDLSTGEWVYEEEYMGYV